MLNVLKAEEVGALLSDTFAESWRSAILSNSPLMNENELSKVV